MFHLAILNLCSIKKRVRKIRVFGFDMMSKRFCFVQEWLSATSFREWPCCPDRGCVLFCNPFFPWKYSSFQLVNCLECSMLGPYLERCNDIIHCGGFRSQNSLYSWSPRQFLPDYKSTTQEFRQSCFPMTRVKERKKLTLGIFPLIIAGTGLSRRMFLFMDFVAFKTW